MKKQLRNSIRKAYNKLTDDEKETLSLISILCVDIDGVSLSNLAAIIGVEPHVFQKEVIALAKADLLAIQVNTIVNRGLFIASSSLFLDGNVNNKVCVGSF